jgi:glyoxylase-like metal-dependent hydrolase (beta-lactamase superfamily II)
MTDPTDVDLPAIDSAGAVEAPTVFAPHPAAPGVTVIPAYLPVPGMGVIAANSFLLDGPEPLLVDSGPGGLTSGAYEAALRSVVDPAALRWLWLTHTDPDHTGALAWLLDAAPDLRVITTYLGAAKLSMSTPVPLDRCRFANPGDRVEVGDRNLLAVRPPTFDAPETTGVLDLASGTLISADTFGALLAEPAARAEDVDPGALADGLVLWSTVDAPWLHQVDRPAYDAALRELRRLAPRHVLSSHLPPATGIVDALLDAAADVPDADPWVGPDQAALEAMLAQLAA